MIIQVFKIENMNIKKVTNISAILLIVAFFLPWLVQVIVMGSASGLKAAQLGKAAVIIWFIPLLSIGVIVTDISNEKLGKYLAIAAGIVPFYLCHFI